MGKGDKVARASRDSKKPRIRKSAPTVREQLEAAAAQREQKQSGKAGRTAAKAVQPLRKLRLGERRPVKIAAKPLRPVGRTLKWLVPKYLVNAWRELRKVVWPSRHETWRLTLAVFIFALVFGALVAGVDKGLDEIFKKVILK
ncbi:MAG TPA: preprotein translocase subunit SecE [Candidatus Saccharimonadales bacterium]|nr:preprotein translocase subunit SecE [Candidatus Saccharimonadales bacterium]